MSIHTNEDTQLDCDASVYAYRITCASTLITSILKGCRVTQREYESAYEQTQTVWSSTRVRPKHLDQPLQ